MLYTESNADTRAFQATLLDPHPDDEALAEAVGRGHVLAQGAADLAIDVEVWDGVGHLRGGVAGPDDFRAVAARVPGVAKLADDLAIRAPDQQPQ